MHNKVKDIAIFLRNNFKQLFGQGFSYAKSYTKNVGVSLDIGSAYVKAIALEKDKQDINIIGFACERLGLDIKDVIKKTLSNLGVNKRELALAISGHGLVLRYVNLPIMSHEEIANSMAFELEKHIPFHKDEVNFDFSILKKNKNTGKMLVLIAAAKKELIEEKVKLCKDVGYNVSFIDAGPLAIANYFEYVEGIKEAVYAIVNLGASVTSLDIIEDGLLVLSRDIFIGGNDFTKRISETFNKDYEQAEQIKLASSDGDLCLVLEPLLNNLTSELKVSFDFYETQANRLIDKILITGGSAQLKGIVDIFKQSLGQEAGLIGYNQDKFKLKSTLNGEDFRKKFNYFTGALGVAIR